MSNALPSNTMLGAHFSAGEMGADNTEITSAAVGNLRSVLVPALEKFRVLLGAPLIITSGYRTPTHNEQVGGSATSDHPNGLGADFIPQGVSLYDAYEKLAKANSQGQLPAFDQLIYYPADKHIHLGMGSRMRKQVLVKIGESYQPIINDVGGAVLQGADAVKHLATAAAKTGAAHPLILVAVVGGVILWAIA